MESLNRFLTLNYGSGDGSGYGSGYGDGDGDGYGYGYGDYGDGLKSFNGDKVYYIDYTPTLINSVKGFTAKGQIINPDLTTKDCYIVRVGNSFAHGETLKQAQSDAEAKHLQESPVEERIELFLKTFKDNETIPAKSLFDWHFNLTGSCLMGREQFVNQKGINLERDLFTIPEFIKLTENSYGSDVIRQLKAEYEQRTTNGKAF